MTQTEHAETRERDDRVPKMGRREIIEDIKSKIDSGEWPPGFKLPATDELVAYYGVAKATIDGVMLVLNTEKVIVSRTGLDRRVAGGEETTGEIGRSTSTEDDQPT